MSDAVAARALQCLDTPFRLYGRIPGVALDCVGLAGFAANLADFPRDYTLRGDFQDSIFPYMDQFYRLNNTTVVMPDGCIALVCCGPRQQHLMVSAYGGWVHAHAGLRRVVHMAGPSPWPVKAVWRIDGE